MTIGNYAGLTVPACEFAALLHAYKSLLQSEMQTRSNPNPAETDPAAKRATHVLAEAVGSPAGVA